MKIDDLYQKFKSCSTVSTDTRKLKQDCMYFALKGDNFDGNKFVSKAFEGGAKFCIVDDSDAVINDNCLYVDDVLSTLQKLATYHRNAIKIPIISLTGSNGKTTTKELINAVLSTTYSVRATIGNLNNHIGVPLTLLRFSEDLDFGIVEMGANHQNEIEFLCGIAQPDYGLITNFGKAHLEGFGSVEGVIKAKSELYDYLKLHKKTAFINEDDEKQVIQIGNYTNTVSFGSSLNNEYTITFESAKPYVTLSHDDVKIESQLIGDYNYSNIAVAVAIGKHFKVSTANIKKAIEAYQPDNNRSEIIEKGTTKIILDAYNANPTSMMAALKNLKQLRAENKFLFLGDMFELGTEAEKEHQAIVNFIELNFGKGVYIIGKNFYKTITNNSTQKFSSFEDLQPILKNINLNNSTVLIKGSRGMALERIMNHI
ncbi:UDP-N-acetylmuramoyl-tripeptide--D-alanyl-D-alanine ligase [Winogradskyella psychrotolerans]|uniref:UDP-N-acetylmuramoyl-tripeptide--D-alanyl-D- alanine ligase n=1 Tax=Winogradskyella psychrotolerans TaxID=1344585 RepID=UPI001C06AA4A|nr:UDP-N-acetylmuramoyl-tripeptide--D-alanyl-D-alanine ligase [Winogradskyella psychrotolerans]MBU2928819.1 UDP-N-acetylmuramoyl-tripeptide--D-alanyl-D-alanine ligase [Winogradskyella psychrotolerans]